MDIGASVQALLSSKDRVIERFYDRLLTQHPELQRHFENRDLRIQASMLTIALTSVEAYYSHRFFATGHYFKVLGHRHFHEGVKADDFSKFETVLMETLADFFAEKWDPNLAAQWKDALGIAFELMREGYQDTYTL